MAAAVALVSLLAQIENCTVIKMSDHCSVPFGLNVPYKDVFTPACLQHDACYQCVSIRVLLYKYRTTNIK